MDSFNLVILNLILTGIILAVKTKILLMLLRSKHLIVMKRKLSQRRLLLKLLRLKDLHSLQVQLSLMITLMNRRLHQRLLL